MSLLTFEWTEKLGDWKYGEVHWKGKRDSWREMQSWSTYGTDVASAQILLNGLRIIKTALTYQLEDREVFVRFLVRQVIFLLSLKFRRVWDPSSVLIGGYQGFSPRSKWPGRETVHFSPPSAEVTICRARLPFLPVVTARAGTSPCYTLTSRVFDVYLCPICRWIHKSRTWPLYLTTMWHHSYNESQRDALFLLGRRQQN
jgi:hypothetical protein